MTGDVEEAVLEMYLQTARPLGRGQCPCAGVSTRKVSQITQALSRVKVGKDAVSRIAGKLEEELKRWVNATKPTWLLLDL